jgi:hypothetical protein
MRAARRGATVLIDLSDGFAPSSDIARTRIEIYRHLGIEVARPVKCSSGEYIHYQWPLPAQVRHFTRISFIAPGESETIAHLGSKPISIRKEIGMGSVILLGSTLGSLLLAGDEQAEDIFTSLLLVNGPNPVDLSREQVENRDRALQI